MDLDDLRDTHNELFPEKPISPIDPSSQGAGVRQQGLAYLAGEVAVEEILDLWSVVFPEAWNVYSAQTQHSCHQPQSSVPETVNPMTHDVGPPRDVGTLP